MRQRHNGPGRKHGRSDSVGDFGSCRRDSRGIELGLALWLSNAQARAEEIRHGLGRREDLVGNFIIAASKTYGEALVTNDLPAPDLVNLYLMVGRMRELGMSHSVASADKLMLAIVDMYFQPNKTIRELHEIIRTAGEIDPLREFTEAARDDLTKAKFH